MPNLNLPATGNRYLTTWKFMRDPFSSYRNWKSRFGDTFMVRALNGDVVATCNPENIRRVFAAKSDAIGQFAIETTMPLMGGSSLFLIEGHQHRRERAMLSPSFHSDRIEGKAELIREIAMATGQNWQAGSRIRIMDWALDISLEVIIRIVFGIRSDRQVAEYKSQIQRFVSSFHPALAFSRLLHRPLLGLSPWNRFIRNREAFHAMLTGEIASRRQEPLDERNMLSRLMHSQYEDGTRVEDDVIRDQLVTMLLAGHETTQIAIAWAMSWLHRTPEVLQRLQAELDHDDSIDSILQSPLLNGICNESLRLNAIVSDIVRKLREPMDWVDHRLPEGTNIAVAICLVHEDPSLYSDPMRFHPDRWEEIVRKPYEFMPFGGGVRRCIGAPLAILEMKIVIAAWIRHFRFQLPTDAPPVEPVYRRNITMAPRTGIPMIYVGRRG